MDTIQEVTEFLSLMEEPEYVSAIVALRDRVAELEARIAELEPLAEYAAGMAVCGYFSRMRGPDAWTWGFSGFPNFGRHKPNVEHPAINRPTPLYAGSAPVPTVDDDARLDMARQLFAAEEELAEMTERKDAAYFERNQVVAALAKCFPSIVTQTEIPGWSPEWHGCVYIQLPTGQVSWHFHESQEYLFAELPRKGAGWDGWDGHDTDEKYRRVNSIPVPAVPQAVDVDAICNAYESGVGHRGRPTANVNPYREGTPEHEAYAIGAKGEAAQQAKVPDDNSYAEFIVVDANENTTEATASGPRKRSLSEAMHYARQYAEDGEIVVYELVEVARMDYSVSAQSAQEGKV